jgi:hypothetical protein
LTEPEVGNTEDANRSRTVVVNGDYDDAVAAVMERAKSDDRSVMDISFEGYEDVQKVGLFGHQFR